MANQNQSADSSSEFENIPDELKLTDSGWYLYDFDSEDPKQPFSPDGTPASWTSGDDGCRFQRAVNAVKKVPQFDTIGYRFTTEDDLFYLDFDGCFEQEYKIETAKEWCPDIERLAESTYCEFSSSGTGVHTILRGDVPDWWEQAETGDEHEGIEIFDSRLCIFTGDVIGTERIQQTEEFPVDFNALLLRLYQQVENEAPDAIERTAEERATTEIVDKYEGDVFDALDRLDPHEIESVIWSKYQQNRNDTFEEWNPDYRQSKSGTSLIYNTETGSWFDFKHNNDGQDEDKLFGTLKLFSAERGRIDSPEDELSGQEWVNAYRNFRSKCEDAGVKLPKLDENKSLSVGGSLSWTDIRNQYAEAHDKTETGKCATNSARKLCEEDDWLKILGEDTLMHYADGMFKRDANKDIFKNTVVDGLDWEYSRQRKRRIYDMMMKRCSVSRESVGCDEGMIVTQNGTLDIIKGELHEWSPEYRATRKLPVEYDPDVEAPDRFLEFLTDVVVSQQDTQKIQEFFGYTLMHWSLPYHKALFLVGATNSGKSTLLDALQLIHDENAISHITPQEMTDNRFDTQMLEDAMVNIRNDIPSETVQNVGHLKEIIAGDDVKVEKKGQDPYEIEPTVKHAFAGNQLPSASVDDEAFYERILLVALPQTVPREEQDKQLLNKIERERSRLLNWALEGLHRLMEQGGFTGDMSASETEQMWQNWSSSVKRYIHECLRVTKDDEDILAKELVMDAFRLYTDARGMPSASQKTLTQTLTSKTGVSHTSYGGTDGSGEYTGVELNETGEEIFAEVDQDDPDVEKLEQLFE
jgi:P4 family phage/plasmid primase-like protien